MCVCVCVCVCVYVRACVFVCNNFPEHVSNRSSIEMKDKSQSVYGRRHSNES